MGGGEGAKERRRLKRLQQQQGPNKNTGHDHQKPSYTGVVKRQSAFNHHKTSPHRNRFSPETSGKQKYKTRPSSQSPASTTTTSKATKKSKKPKHLKRKLEKLTTGGGDQADASAKQALLDQLQAFEAKKAFFEQRKQKRQAFNQHKKAKKGDGERERGNQDNWTKKDVEKQRVIAENNGDVVMSTTVPVPEPQMLAAAVDEDGSSGDLSNDDSSSDDSTVDYDSPKQTKVRNEEEPVPEPEEPEMPATADDDDEDGSSGDSSSGDSSSDGSTADSVTPNQAKVRNEEDKDSSDEEDDSDKEDEADEPRRQRGKRRRGRKDTSQKVVEQSEGKEGSVVSEKGSPDEEGGNEDKNEQKDDSTGNRKRERKGKDDGRYCIGRKPVTDYIVGQEHTAKVVYVKPFGVFFDIGCHSDAFCHVSRLSDDYVEKPETMFQEGQECHARIVEIDRKQKRITVSLQSSARLQDERASIEARKRRKESRKQKVGGGPKTVEQ